jgi:2'-5' RNA ligase
MKEITGPLLPGYKIYEYLLVLNPHEELRNKIMQVKKDFNQTYKAATALYSKPHLTLASFTQYGLIENRITQHLKTIAMGYHPIKIELKDYGSFPAHTIYINVTSKVPIQNLIKTIRGETQCLMKLNEDNKPHFIMEPHLTIARKLLPWQYEKGWLEYSHKHFTGRFIADAMLLLKRPVNEFKYEIVQRFVFENLPVNTKQGELFSSLSSKGGT